MMNSQSVFQHHASQQRRSKARQELIKIQLQIASLLEPEDQTDKGDHYWSERQWLQERADKLVKVIEEPFE